MDPDIRGGPRSFTALRAVALAAVLALVAGSCAGGDSPPATEGTPGPELVAQVASYDLHAGPELRFIVGLLTKDQQLVTGGKVQMVFSYLGTKDDPIEDPAPGPRTIGEFIEVPKEEGDHHHGDSGAGPPGDVGVYSTRVTFDRPGFWKVEVAASSPEGPATAEASFEVLPDNLVPAPGDMAPLVENLTMDSTDAPARAVDSRGETFADIPDPELHRTTVKAAIEAGRPVLLVISTPTYCLSRFCGPITDMLFHLSEDYPDKAEYIHIEVWRDRDGNAINKAAAEWIFRNEDLQEPWVFLIGGDGRVLARWDNVATRGEVEPMLRALP